MSAYPDRYQNYQPVAEAILTALTRPAPSSGGGNGGDVVVPETTRVVFPLPEGSWVRTSPFGWRTDPITFETAFHSGSDFAAADVGEHVHPRPPPLSVQDAREALPPVMPSASWSVSHWSESIAG